MLYLLPLTLALSAFSLTPGLKGPELKEKGWKEIARCPGHEWHYLLKKGGETRICSGINARGGPEEFPCEPFAGKTETFKKCQNRINPKANF